MIFCVRLAAFPRARRLAEEVLHLKAKTDSVFLETVRGIRAIKLSGREADRHAIWHNAAAHQQDTIFSQSAFGLWGQAGLGAWQGTYTLAMLYIGALQVINGNLTLGMFFAFQSYAGQFSGRVGSLVGAYFNYRMVGLHLERLADLVHTDPEAGLDGPLLLSKPLSGSIKAIGVRFRYAEFDRWIVRDASFDIKAGEIVAFVGKSGGGKTTLLKLLIGLYAPEDGQILLDGHSIRALGVRAVRRQIGVVMQDDQLLSGTVADNVAFFDSEIDMAAVERACKLAHVHEDVMRTAMGYHSMLGDMGSVLSGGQKQRILLARALYKKPDILFLDEGTANLDAELESRVMEAIASLGITVVMVAHRQGAIHFADRVFEIEDGVLSEVTGQLVRSVPASPVRGDAG